MVTAHQTEIATTRVGGFGGSDAALFARIAERGLKALSATDNKRIAVAMGLIPYTPAPTTEAMQAGHVYEDITASEPEFAGYQREYKMTANLASHFATFAHADLYKEGDVIELKWVNSLDDIDDVINRYYPQLQWYYMLGASKVTLQWGFGNLDFAISQDKVIPKDDKYIKTLLWGIKILDDTIDGGWYPDMPQELYVTPDTPIYDDIVAIEELLRQKEALDSQIATLKKRISDYLDVSGYGKVFCPQGKITYLSRETKKLDTDKIKKEYPEVYNNSLKVNTNKVLTYKFTKKK